MEAQTLTPQLIGRSFVNQFYSVLHQKPEFVHKFYLDDSTMSRPALDGSLTTVTTMKDINDFILSLDYKGCRSEITEIEAQLSFKDGVTVLVTGCLTGEDNVRRKFTESFFLAPQNTGGYYVLNDAFRFIDEEDRQPSIAAFRFIGEEDRLPSIASVDMNESDENAAATSAKEPELSDTQDQSSPNLTDQTVEEPVVVEPPVEEPVVVEPPIESDKHIDDQVAVESSSNELAEKKSYASIVKNRNGVKLTTPARVTSTMKKSSKNNGAKKSVPRPLDNGSARPAEEAQKVAAVFTNAAESSAPNDNTKQNGNDIDDTKVNADKGYSVYIGNLPYNATAGNVENEFKKFGPIKRGGIQVRCNQGFGFGFVEYESLSSAQKAIEASPIRIGDFEAFVQEKKTNTRVVNGVITYLSGRGRYHNNGFRGRGNFSGNGGYGRNDYGRRGGDHANGARNGEGYHRGFQNGGGGNNSSTRSQVEREV